MELLTGAIVSLIVQVIKKYFGTSEYVTLGIFAMLSLAGAAVYTYLVAAGYWQVVLQVIMSASAFYSIILARFASMTTK
jgi:hypothetical protein